MSFSIRKLVCAAVIAAPALALFPALALADTYTTNFETFTSGAINGQDGWMFTGPYDAAISDNSSIPVAPTSFATRSLRISDAQYSGSFGDWVFAKPLTNAAGESAASAGTFSEGTLQPHFEMEFDIASASSTLQSGLHVSVSPDRGDGSRMSYLRFEDGANGINVFFDDATDPGPVGTTATFNEVEVASSLSHNTPHHIKLTIDFHDGPNNDVVKVYVDGTLVHTGGSWEDYYRYDPESSAEQNTRIVKTVIFQVRGSNDPTNAGAGFLFDNFSETSGPIPVPNVSVHIFKFIDSIGASTTNATASFPMQTTYSSANLGSGTNVPFTLSPTGWGAGDQPYEASFSNANAGANYATNEVTGGSTVGANCNSGQPYMLAGYKVGDTFADALAAAATTTSPSFTNLQGDKYVLVLNQTCPVIQPNTGSLEVVKLSLPGDGTFDFTGNKGIASFSITTSNYIGTKLISNLKPGNYTIKESSQKGWSQLYNSCDSVKVQANQTSTCFVVNVQKHNGKGDKDNDHDDGFFGGLFQGFPFNH